MTRFTSDNQQGKNFTLHFETDDKGHFFAIQDLACKCIDNHPIADVVEVVRCKDCKYWKDASVDAITEVHWGECRKPLGDYRCCETAEYDFCSYGERRETDVSVD